MSTRVILSANLKALMAARPELDTLKKITAQSRGKLSNGKLDRIRRASHATDIDALGDLAEVFRLEPWQLLVPRLNPEALPQIAGDELLASIRSLVLNQSTQQESDSSNTPPPSGKKKPLGRLPGETIRTGRDGGKTGEVNRPAAIPRKRSR